METTARILESSWGIYSDLIATWTEKAQKNQTLKRIREKDASVWSKDPAVQKEIKERLGWLDAPKRVKTETKEITAFAAQIKDEGFTHVLLLGMGGSSLAPEFFLQTFGSRRNYPELLVLDSTDPEKIREIEQKIAYDKTLFVVSSKSGGTIELISLYKYFFARAKEAVAEKAPQHFIAITDPGSPLETTAKAEGFRRVFQGQTDVGGRFSALSPFGLVPAALIGVDIQKLLESALSVKDEECLKLGLGMAVLAEEGRDKLTLLFSKSLASFGDWVEQLVAESTGKEGLGIVPVAGETLSAASFYGNDRFFVALLFEKDKDPKFDAKLSDIQAANHPMLVYRVETLEAMGAEIFRWEIATAIACALLKVNAFDQPDVQSAKDKTKAILKAFEETGSIETPEAALSEDRFWAGLQKNDYCALLAFLPDRDFVRKKLTDLQTYVREKTLCATTLGFGPRYLHSTGQLHKGGSPNGLFVIITAPHASGLAVPGEKYKFEDLEMAQAMGDFETLQCKGRRVFHYTLESLSEESLSTLVLRIKNDIRKFSNT